MSVRAEVVAQASSVVSRARFLEEQRNSLLEQIEAAKQRIEDQKSWGGLLAALISRDDLPSLQETRERISTLRRAIESEKQQQVTFQNQTANFQSSIETSIAMRQKRAQYDKVATDTRSLSLLLDDERQKESRLKFQQSQLSAEILRTQLNKTRLEQRLSAELEPQVDLTSFQKKKKSLLEQTELVLAKRQAFEQELVETTDQLERLRIRQNQLKQIAGRSEGIDVATLQNQILERATENVDLRSYQALPRDAESLLEELNCLAETSATLIDRSRLELD
jgi:hypothetical protein